MIDLVEVEENEVDSSLALAHGIMEGKWPHSVDAREWAQEWAKTFGDNPSIANDEEYMIGWFANAIMAGYDHACLQQHLNKE